MTVRGRVDPLLALRDLGVKVLPVRNSTKSPYVAFRKRDTVREVFQNVGIVTKHICE